MKNSLLIILCFILGVLLSYFSLFDALLPENPNVSFYVLCALMFCVGMNMGHDPDIFKKFKNIQLRLLLLPLFTALGSLAAMALLSIVMPYKLADSLAVGSGFAYYSLSSIIISHEKGALLGTLALLVNIFRELLTLLLAPLLRKVFGPLALIASGGATTLDVTLPVILKTNGTSYLVPAIYHGMVLDFSVPFLVSFFCSL